MFSRIRFKPARSLIPLTHRRKIILRQSRTGKKRLTRPLIPQATRRLTPHRQPTKRPTQAAQSTDTLLHPQRTRLADRTRTRVIPQVLLAKTKRKSMDKWDR
jgi:hypothetical protein